MANPISTGNHPAALWPGVHKFVMGRYPMHGNEYNEIFKVEKSSMAYEEDVETTSFGLASQQGQGTGVSYDSHTQGATKRYTHVAYGLGYIVTREERDDNLYRSKSFQRAGMLADSFKVTKETVAANVLNRAFNSSYTGMDGKELLATDHPTLAGTFANEPAVAADLNEASLEDAVTAIQQFKNSRGLQVRVMPEKLIVAPSNWANAERILNSDLRSGTDFNDVNALRSKRMLPGGAVVNHYLTDADAWFVKTNVDNGLCMFMRTAFEFTRDNDFDTSNAKAKGYERYSVGWTDPRGLYGSPGA